MKVVDVSKTHSRYFEDEAGKTWVPIGCNICFDRLYGDGGHSRGEVPETVSGEKIPFSGPFECYLPWEDRWVDVEGCVLPDFTRSVVVRMATPEDP